MTVGWKTSARSFLARLGGAIASPVTCALFVSVGVWIACAGEEGTTLNLWILAASLVPLAFAIRRRSSVRLFLALVVAISLPFVGPRAVAGTQASLSRVLTRIRLDGMRRDFTRMLEDVRRRAYGAARELTPAVIADPDSCFRLLLRQLGDRYTGFVLYRQQPVAWGGRIPGFLESPPPVGESVYRTEVSTYYALVVDLPGAPACKLVAYRLLSAHTDIWNRWLVDYDFFGVHPERGTTGMRIEYLTGVAGTPSDSTSGQTVVELPDKRSPLVRMTVDPIAVNADKAHALLPYALFVPLIWSYVALRKRTRIARPVYALLVAALLHRISVLVPASTITGPSYFAMPVVGDLFGSPLDLLLCAVVLAVIAGSLPLGGWLSRAARLRRFGLLVAPTMTFFAGGLIIAYQRLLGTVIESVSGGLLFYPLGAGFGGITTGGAWAAHFVVQSALLIYLAVGVYLAAFSFGVCWTVLEGIRFRAVAVAVIGLLTALLYARLLRGASLPFYPTLLAYLLLAASSSVDAERWTWKRIVLYGLPMLAFFLFSVDHYSERTRRHLVEAHTVPRITGDRAWAQYLLTRSLRQIDEYKPSNGYGDPHLAFKLWGRTDLALFGFSSGVEVWDPAGSLLSRFDLNMEPVDFEAPQTPDLSWRVREVAGTTPAANGAFVAERAIGPGQVHVRITAQRSYENLLFLSAVNPYLTLFRSAEIEILEENLFGGRLSLLVIDMHGRVVFNPAAIEFNLSREVAERLTREARMFWLSFDSGRIRYHGLLFQSGQERCLLFYPRTRPSGYVAMFVRLLLQAALLAPLALLLSGARPHRPGGRIGFATKVYAWLLLSSLVPLLAYTALLREYLDRRLREETERHGVSVAQVARKFIEDFVAYRLDRDEKPAEIFNDDLALWIQRIVRQDLDIFQGRRLVATSKRELYESGLVQEFVDGQVYERIVRARSPFYHSYGYLGKVPILTINTPLTIAGMREPLILSVPIPVREREMAPEREELGQSIVLISTIVVVFALVIAQRLARRISKPVETLVEGTAHVAHGDFDFRIPAEGQDEVRTLIDSFNKMAQDLKKYQAETIESSRLKVLAEMARRVAHEIKNPLTPIQLSVEHMRKVYRDRNPEFPTVFDHCIENVLREVEVLRKLSLEFGMFSRTEEPTWKKVDLKGLIEEITEPYSYGASDRITYAIQWSPARTHYVLDRDKMRRALSNVFLNAVQATSAGTIEWRIEEGEGRVRIVLTDTGSGIPPEVLGKLFHPYFSTKDRGTGLGLAITKKDIEDQGGEISIESTQDRGTTVRMRLPIYGEEKIST